MVKLSPSYMRALARHLLEDDSLPRSPNPMRTRRPSLGIPSNSSVRRLFYIQMIRAKRAGSWFKLPKRERGLFELAMRLDVKLRSHDLLKALMAVLRTLKEKLDPIGVAYFRAMKMAWAFSEAAVKAGNVNAHDWRNSSDFIWFLAITNQVRLPKDSQT